MIVIDPYFNHTQALLGDKWFSPRLGTDVAMGLAIAYTWLTEGTYDKEYIAGRTTGFDEWKDYVLGKTDGMAKTPEWAEAESGIPAREIRALAREWASKKTMLAAGGPGGMGGACRASSGNEWARTMVALAAMQGLGKPGSNIWGTTSGAPRRLQLHVPRLRRGRHLRRHRPTRPPASASSTACSPTAGPSTTRTTPPKARRCRACASPRPCATRRSSGGARASAARTSRASSRSTSTRPRAIPPWGCTTATAARSSAP